MQCVPTISAPRSRLKTKLGGGEVGWLETWVVGNLGDNDLCTLNSHSLIG